MKFVNRLAALSALVALMACSTPGGSTLASRPVGTQAIAAMTPFPSSVGASTAIPAPSITPTPASTATTFATLTSRTWSLLLKAPDSYAGKGYKLWACISEFDALTGLDTFRAQASYQRETYWYIRGSMTVFTGDATKLAPFVKGDVVTMNVVDLGAYGGLPEFRVVSIQRKASCAQYL